MYTKKQVLKQLKAMGMKWYYLPIEWFKLTFCKKYRSTWMYSKWMYTKWGVK